MLPQDCLVDPLKKQRLADMVLGLINIDRRRALASIVPAELWSPAEARRQPRAVRWTPAVNLSLATEIQDNTAVSGQKVPKQGVVPEKFNR